LAAKIELEHEEIRRGLKPPPTDQGLGGRRPVSDVIDEYLAWGSLQGGRGGRPWAASHAKSRRKYLDWWSSRLDLGTMADLRGRLPDIQDALAELQEAGRSTKTLQTYLEALKSLTGWCLKRGILRDDPLTGMTKFNTTPDIERRALSLDEVQALLEAAPEYRRIVYQVALCSGLRATELRSLKSHDLDVQRGGLHLSPEWTKNRKPGFQPLARWLIDELRDYALSGKAEQKYREAYPKQTIPAPARSTKVTKVTRRLWKSAFPFRVSLGIPAASRSWLK